MSTYKPGTVMGGWDGETQGQVVALATSRHKAVLTADEGRLVLARAMVTDYMGADTATDSEVATVLTVLSDRKPYTWRSVTKKELEEGTHDCVGDCEQGGWCTAGSGNGWVEVLYLSYDAGAAALEDES